MDSNSNSAQNSLNAAATQSPLLLLNNMSNLMSTKLDSCNYIIWKLQISAVLDAYSMIEHLDGSTPQPRQFLNTETGMQTVNPAFLIWKKRDKALLTLLYSTLSSPVLAMVVGLSTSQEVWNKLEERFTCTARANVLNLKLELQSIKKGSDSVSTYLQRIKAVRDKLSAVGVQSDPEELLHVILKGLPKEYASFASAIRTRDGVLSLEKLSVLLQTEEQSMQESADPLSNSALAMFVTPNKHFNGYNGNQSYNNNRGRGGRNFSRGRGGRSSNFNSSSFNASNFKCTTDPSPTTVSICSSSQNPTTKLAAMASASNLQHTQGSETWLTDSGASDHISASSQNLHPQAPYLGQDQVSVGNGQQVPIQSIAVHFDANKLLIQDLPTGRVLYKGLSRNGVYPIHSSNLFTSAFNKTACAASSFSAPIWQLWHSRLGHPSNKVLSSIFPSLQCNTSLSESVKTHCTHCLAGKMHQLPFPVSNKTVSSPFSLIHADLWGPAPIVSYTGFKYYLVLVDEFTKFTWTYLLKHKSDTLQVFTQFHAMLSCPHTPQQNGTAERKHRHLIQCALALLSESKLPISYWSYAVSTAAHLINRLPTPNLKQKTPWELLFHKPPDIQYLRTFGCQCFPLLTPYTAHKLHPKTTSCVFLGYPTNTKGYLCLDPVTKRVYTSRHVLFNEHVFPGLIHTSDSSASSSHASASPIISSDTWLNTLLYLHTCSHTTADNPPISTESCPVSTVLPTTNLHSALTNPNQTQTSMPPLSNQQIQPSSPTILPLPPDTPPTPSLPTESPNTPAISPLPVASFSPLPTAPAAFVPHPMQTRSKHGIFKPKVSYSAQTSTDYSITEPSSFTTASKHPQWCTAMNEEFEALQHQGTWVLVPQPPSKNIVGCKWVYKLKYNSDGTIARYKARLVAKGFHQQYGVDFDETFSPVVKPPTVRLILSLAVSLGWSLRQLDVKNAFLHGTLKEEVYMTQPQGYVDPKHPSHVCKLIKSIYGLKQAPRAWFESFTTQLLHLGFTASTADSSLFIYKHEKVIAYLLLYVDDIVLTSNTPSYLDKLITQLSAVFDLKDLGSLHYFLGLQVTRSSNGLYLNQAKYAHDLLKKHNMLDSKPAKSPSCPNTRLSLHDGDPLPDPHGYRSLVGALHYLTFTRPDLSFSVHQVCQYMSTPTTIHLAAAKRILRYIRGTLNHGIAFSPGPIQLSAYTDADWAGDPDDRRSTSGFLVYLGSNPITWSAKKQPTVSRSSTESEYRALAIASAELCWIRTLLKDLGVYLSHTPILWCDNVSALAIASNPVFHARTKHIEVDFHFVRERVLRKDLLVQFVSTIDQLADIFTKSLPTHRFLDLQRNLTVSVPAIEGG
uniref:Integrase catalytic domain-containing protein n=1 Tax=Fagus sylvatica TaxID=28930 RepID=A0A2N9H7L1_FAGSY